MRNDSAALAERLGAQLIAPGLLRIDRVIRPGTLHGRVPLDGPASIAGIARLGSMTDHERASSSPLFLDTETTGLSGGTGTVVFLLGMARFEAEELHVSQLMLSAFAGEQAMYALAAKVAGTATPLVSFNGKSFDSPLVATRARLCSTADPLSGRAHVDLLHPLRSAFKDRWENCRLGTAEAKLLKFHRSGVICRVVKHRRHGLIGVHRGDTPPLATSSEPQLPGLGLAGGAGTGHCELPR